MSQGWRPELLTADLRDAMGQDGARSSPSLDLDLQNHSASALLGAEVLLRGNLGSLSSTSNHDI
jgi:hypothetical protein